MRRFRFLLWVLVTLAACEPLAPEVTQQVIVITNTPTAEIPVVTQTAVFCKLRPDSFSCHANPYTASY
ncbi:MAG: hypothetical protein K8I82_26485 [Anaerolineae bacterium]|nr:hypothetical protein [Anaerolineae bacterium]